MITVLFKGGLACPMFQCDHCEAVIGDVTEGWAVFLDHNRRHENVQAIVRHYHAFRCLEKATHAVRGYDLQALGAHVYWLMANLEIDPQKLRQLKLKYAR